MLDPFLWLAFGFGWASKKKSVVSPIIAGAIWGIIDAAIVLNLYPYIMSYREKMTLFAVKTFAACLFALAGYGIGRMVEKRKTGGTKTESTISSKKTVVSLFEKILPVAKSKKCPYCAEKIKIEAIVCKHCGRDLPQTVTTGA